MPQPSTRAEAPRRRRLIARYTAVVTRHFRDGADVSEAIAIESQLDARDADMHGELLRSIAADRAALHASIAAIREALPASAS